MAWEGGMTFCFVNLKHKQTWLRPACLAIASLAALTASCDRGDAASSRNEHSVASVESRTGDDPIMAIVSLSNQRITVYDANGWILRAPASSGQKKGRETPAGIFSVIQKDAEHYSNLYDVPTCRICSASLGRASRSTVALCRGVADLEQCPEGLCVTVRRSKTDQKGAGAVIAVCHGAIACPVAAVLDWLAAANITEGPVFRGVNKDGRLLP